MRGTHNVLWIGAVRSFPSQHIQRAPGLDVTWETDAESALAVLPGRFHAAVIDFAEIGRSRDVVIRVREAAPRLPLLVRTRAPTKTRRDGLTRAGASRLLDVEHPAEEREQEALLDELRRLISERRGPDPIHDESREPVDAARTLTGRSAAMKKLRAWVRRAARSRASVLIVGETGTGKERVARAIHALGTNASGPFVAINCAALPESLLEAELTGHRRGAFTGAERDRRGLVEEASGGTLFLDEVAESSPAFQAKLLRIIQERLVRPLGGGSERQVDVRFLAATHRDLALAMRRGRFREDLYYRLAVLVVDVPPLRARSEDIPLLAEELLSQLAEDEAHGRLPPPARALLESHSWPGNVRELENELQRAVALALPGEALSLEHFFQTSFSAPSQDQGATHTQEKHEPLQELLTRVERQIVRQRLREHGGRRNATARSLGVTREGLWKKLKRLDIE